MPIMTASRKLSALTTSVKLFRTKARHIYWLDLLSLSPETHHLSGDVINIPADLLNDKTRLSGSQWIVRQLLALCAWKFIRKLSALPFNTLDTLKLLNAIWASWISNFCPTLLVWWVWASAARFISKDSLRCLSSPVSNHWESTSARIFSTGTRFPSDSQTWNRFS